MKHLNSVIIAIFLAVSLQAISQEPNTVIFSYDASGNRITRETIYFPPKSEKPVKGPKEDTTGITNPDVLKTEIVKHTANVGTITINIFPNPTGGMFKIVFEGWEKETKAGLHLHTLSGTEVKKIETLEQETNIDITSQPKGTYILTVIVNGKKETWKVVKK